MFEYMSRTGYIIIIALILSISFLSQQPFAAQYGKQFYFGAMDQGKVVWSKVSDWTVSEASATYAKISGGAHAGGGADSGRK